MGSLFLPQVKPYLTTRDLQIIVIGQDHIIVADVLMKSCELLPHIDGLVQERRNSSALAMDLRLSCINPLK